MLLYPPVILLPQPYLCICECVCEHVPFLFFFFFFFFFSLPLRLEAVRHMRATRATKPGKLNQRISRIYRHAIPGLPRMHAHEVSLNLRPNISPRRSPRRKTGIARKTTPSGATDLSTSFLPLLSLSLSRVSRYPPSLSRLTSNVRVITARLCMCFTPFCSQGDPNHYRTPCWKLKKLVLENFVFVLYYYYCIYVLYMEGGLYR